MISRLQLATALLVLLLCRPIWAAEEVSFAREILPILSDKCFLCHGPDETTREEDLRLDLRDEALAAGVIVPGHPEKSEVIARIFSGDADDQMPPPKSHLALTAAQKEALRSWIKDGAPYEKHWAFVTPPVEVTMPPVKDGSWAGNPIDRFILARLEAEGLEPSPPASRERWLRRVTFDLTGLPPTQEELDAFLADSSPGAFEKVVDRLLASARYGERMAVPWLDLARYADSFGYQADVDSLTWPYRDWLIGALNRNLPFDEFLTEQLAGDLIPGASRDQKLATAFNRLHRMTNEGGSIAEEFRQEGIADRVHTLGTAFLGLTMECARCHDHKYDPISTEDYYSMGAFFNSIDEFGMIMGGSGRGEILPQPTLLLPTPGQEKEMAKHRKNTEGAADELVAYLAGAESRFEAWLAAGPDLAENDLAARFSFEEGEDGKLVNGLNPKETVNLSGNVLGPGKAGTALLADGDSLTKLPDFGLKHADQSFSISLWLKPGEPYPRAVVFSNTSSFDRPFSGYDLLLQDGHLHWTLARELPGCGASISTAATIPVGQWTHLTVTNDGSRRAAGLRVFLNGEEAETQVEADNFTRDYRVGNGLVLGARGRDFGIKGGMIDDLVVYRRAITPLEARALHEGGAIDPLRAPRAELRRYYFSAIDPGAREIRKRVAAARAAYRTVEAKVADIVTMRETAEPRPAYILERGDYTLPGRQVERKTPAWLPPFPEDQPRNRLGFARWLTGPDHPLTARVTINRLWQEMFGRGLVATADNFGLQGAQPTHPDLLDWLARDFINHGWDQKRALKQMVLSNTYRQDSRALPALRERDPENELLARGPARRLTAEMLRDSALVHGGLLVEKVGGPSVYPYQAPGSMWKVLNNFLPEYKQDTGEGLYRRSLYTFWRRTTTPPNMIILDATAREACTVSRQSTNTPLQALVTLNDPQYVEAARKFGERILREGGATDESRARWAFREITGESPDARRLAILAELLAEQRKLFAAGENGAGAGSLLAVGVSPADGALDEVELAAATVLAQCLLNLDAHITLR